MTENQIKEEIIRYLCDSFYDYAIMITGEWGIGKTFLADGIIKDLGESSEKNYGRHFEYISLYGCRSVEDVKRNIVWALGCGVIQKYSPKQLSDVLAKKDTHSDSKLATLLKTSSSEVLHKTDLDSSAYEMTINNVEINQYVFVVDDLERCDCPINEVFGIFNGLVEHKQLKVIFLANENEIKNKQDIQDRRELQYYYSLNKDIAWPKDPSVFDFDSLGQRSVDRKLTLNEIERRRELLFPEQEIDEEYIRVKEKLIGVTLVFTPNLSAIMKTIIDKAPISEDTRAILLDSLDGFATSMDLYHHHNLRTFKFFLSKLDYLITQVDWKTVDEYYVAAVKGAIINETFICSLEYKSNFKNITNPYLLYKRESLSSKAIREYVYNGDLDQKHFLDDVTTILNKLKNHLPVDDPLMQLTNEYYCNTQEWCEKRLEELIDKLLNDHYDPCHYEKIIIILLKLSRLGFDNSYFERAKDLIIKNILASKVECPLLSNDLFFIEETSLKNEVRAVYNEINAVITTKKHKDSKKTISEILSGNNWVSELNKYTNADSLIYLDDSPVFYLATSDQWYTAIHNATPRQLYEFRNWLYKQYPSMIEKACFTQDKEILYSLWEKLDPDKEDDLIKKQTIRWIKDQIEEIFKSNQMLLEDLT